MIHWICEFTGATRLSAVSFQEGVVDWFQRHEILYAGSAEHAAALQIELQNLSEQLRQKQEQTDVLYLRIQETKGELEKSVILRRKQAETIAVLQKTAEESAATRNRYGFGQSNRAEVHEQLETVLQALKEEHTTLAENNAEWGALIQEVVDSQELQAIELREVRARATKTKDEVIALKSKA